MKGLLYGRCIMVLCSTIERRLPSSAPSPSRSFKKKKEFWCSGTNLPIFTAFCTATGSTRVGLTRISEKRVPCREAETKCYQYYINYRFLDDSYLLHFHACSKMRSFKAEIVSQNFVERSHSGRKLLPLKDPLSEMCK